MIGHCFSKAIKKGEKLELLKNSRLRFINVFLVNICDELRMRDRMRLESVCIRYDIDQCSRTSRQRLTSVFMFFVTFSFQDGITKV